MRKWVWLVMLLYLPIGANALVGEMVPYRPIFADALHQHLCARAHATYHAVWSFAAMCPTGHWTPSSARSGLGHDARVGSTTLSNDLPSYLAEFTAKFHRFNNLTCLVRATSPQRGAMVQRWPHPPHLIRLLI